MRFLLGAAAALALLAAPAFAQAPQTATSAGASATTPPARERAARPRQTLEQHFQAANASNDGHLTQSQAQGARWSAVARDFDGIDKAHKGYVTVEDIRGFYRERRAARAQQRAASATSHG